MYNDHHGAPKGQGLSRDVALRWLESGCWVSLGLAPLLYWIDGPAVSHDQFLVRTSVVASSGCVAVGLRVRTWIRRNWVNVINRHP
jgi:hypothetical protein